MTTILIADDNADLRNLLMIQLGNHGFSVLAATDGLEAIEIARSASPALILMDLNMPELDGWEATCQLKRDPQLKDIPVIALTAYSLPGDKVRALHAGCEGFHSKPVDIDALLVDINRLAATDGKDIMNVS